MDELIQFYLAVFQVLLSDEIDVPVKGVCVLLVLDEFDQFQVLFVFELVLLGAIH